MGFTKLTEAEQAEFMELIKDSYDPELYTEDDLPKLRASQNRLEEKQRREEAIAAPDECSGPLDEDPEPPSDWFDRSRWNAGE